MCENVYTYVFMYVCTNRHIWLSVCVFMYMCGFAPGAREAKTNVSTLGGLINTRTHKRTRNAGAKGDRWTNVLQWGTAQLGEQKKNKIK